MMEHDATDATDARWRVRSEGALLRGVTAVQNSLLT